MPHLEEGELEDWEYPDQPDETHASEDEDHYIKCPECGQDVYEDAPQCPSCGAYVLASSTTRLAPLWTIVAIIALAAFALTALRLF